MPTDDPLDRYVFAVRDRPYCLWGYDLARENEVFLRSFDSGYFEYLAHLHLDNISGESTSKAAIALRAAYHHGLEALFSFLGALSQAPEAVSAWIPRCRTSDLRGLVEDIHERRPVLTQCGRQSLSWQELSEIVHANVWQDEVPKWTTARRFAKVWSRFASDYLNELHIEEYNSIKHGFRASSGGSFLRMGLQPSEGVPAAESDMVTIGASPHGTSFSTVRAIPAHKPNSPHVRLLRQRLNWRAESMGQSLQLLSWSVSNVVGFLRVLNGAPSGTIRFLRPEDADCFEAPWRWPVGVLSGAMNVMIDENEVVQVSASELLAELEGRKVRDEQEAG